MHDDQFNKQRLEEDLTRSIVQFQRYANIPSIDRNNFIVKTLEELLSEAKKLQLQESKLHAMAEYR